MKNPAEVDVLIIGAGPAGLMLANWLSRLNVSVRIVDKRSAKIITGQADGVQSRTLEVLKSFDIADQLIAEANTMLEVCFWNPDPQTGRFTRTSRMSNALKGSSRYCGVAVLHQGRIESFFLDKMRAKGVEVERSVLPDLLEIDETKVGDIDSYPVKVRLTHLTEEQSTPAKSGPSASGKFCPTMSQENPVDTGPKGSLPQEGQEIVKAKFVVGCDGARSWVRKELGYELVGEASNYCWGVIDGTPVTNFPDIRLRCAIHSQFSGSIMVIPRENGMVRLYVQLGELPPGERMDRSDVTPEKLIAAARRIMAPFTIDIPEVEWFTCYEIGQRICMNFSKFERVFLAGDACHTHSPKAGQGMNVSMMDTYNLGWKLAHVINKIANPKVLATYEAERRQVAKDLIKFDYELSRLYSGKPQMDPKDSKGVDLEHFKEFFIKGIKFTSGFAVDYQPSCIVAKPGSGFAAQSNQELAKNALLGQSFQVVSLSDARPWHIGDRLISDGRWRLLVLPGDVRIPTQRTKLDNLSASLDSPEGAIRKFTPKGKEFGDVIEVLTVLGCPRVEVEEASFHDILRPCYGKFNYRNYWQMQGVDYLSHSANLKLTHSNYRYVDDESHHQGHGHAYEGWGVDPKVGAVIAIRPDGYVALVTSLDGHEEISKFFDAFMLKPTSGCIDADVGHSKLKPQEAISCRAEVAESRSKGIAKGTLSRSLAILKDVRKKVWA